MAAVAPEDSGLHRALADERRRQLVEELQGERSGLDVQELSRRLELHANTVRWHLGILADAGIVESRPAARTTPGRPRVLYKLSPRAVDRGQDEHRLLAAILAGTVAASPDGTCAAEESGRAWGRYLTRRQPQLADASDERAVEEVVRLLDEQGFEPEARGAELHMHRCPFHDLAEQHPEVVCAVHRGLISGALDELGSRFEVSELAVFVRPNLCVARLGARASASSS
ncbi:MAG TPA: helix-turn-helix domain-containing protein [Gaiellaceae bacterium]|nr:helix-turn-helix domain-containing protein [Gaiellaceae bacterium]